MSQADTDMQEVKSKLDTLAAEVGKSATELALLNEKLAGEGGVRVRVGRLEESVEDLKRAKWWMTGAAAGISFALHWVFEFFKGHK
jgi:hypothetical protein